MGLTAEEKKTIFEKRLFAVSKANTGIKYSDDYGKTWNFTNIRDGSFEKPIKFGNILIIRCIFTGDYGILYSDDYGKTWKPTSLNTGYFQEIVETGDGSLLVTSILKNGGAWRSVDGVNWESQKGIDEEYSFCKGIELSVANSSLYISQLISNFDDIGGLIAKNILNVHQLQSEVAALQEKCGLEVTSKVTGTDDTAVSFLEKDLAKDVDQPVEEPSKDEVSKESETKTKSNNGKAKGKNKNKTAETSE